MSTLLNMRKLVACPSEAGSLSDLEDAPSICLFRIVFRSANYFTLWRPSTSITNLLIVPVKA